MHTLKALLAGLALTATGTLMAAPALAGPSLSGITNTRIQGSVVINTNFGESFSVNGNTSLSGDFDETTQPIGTITPFAATVGLNATQINPSFNGGDPTDPSVNPTIAAAGTNALVGHVGTAILAVSAVPSGNSLGTTPGVQQVTATAGLVQLGGSGTIGGTLAFNLPSSLVLNQSDTDNGIPSIVLQGSGSEAGLIGASINGTQVGPSNLSADLTIVNQLINSLSAF
jgi:hypothetical protein